MEVWHLWKREAWADPGFRIRGRGGGGLICIYLAFKYTFDSDITLVLCLIEACVDGSLKTLHSPVIGVLHQGLWLLLKFVFSHGQW